MDIVRSKQPKDQRWGLLCGPTCGIMSLRRRPERVAARWINEVDQMANEYIRFTDDMSAPYSDLVVVDGKFLFLSGLVSEDLESGELVCGTITVETRQVLDNLKVLLKRHGSDMDHVVRIDVLLRDFSERDEMNAEYVRHFDPKHMPARLCYGNVGLADQCKIEIAVTAVKA